MLTRRNLLKFAPGMLAVNIPLAPGSAAAMDAAVNADIHARDNAVDIIRGARTIVTERGVTRLEAVEIGGIKQWISIRGTDRKNPVLLYVHGGPGYVSMPMSWWFGRGWEEYFTVVHWDQRGAGKTYL
jgi:proline iminopeptidase